MKISIPLVAFLLSATPLTALAAPKISDFDTDTKKQVLSQAERKEMRKTLKSDRSDASVQLLFALDEAEKENPNLAQLPIVFVTEKIQVAADDCVTKQPFFLRSTLRDISFLDCGEPIAKGGSISFSKDNQNNTQSTAVKVALGFPIFSTGEDFGKYRNRRPGFSLDDFAILAFVEADGTIKEGASNEGTTRLGLEAEFWTSSPISELSVWDLAAYYQTDLEIDSKAYGTSLSYTPYIPSLNINSTTLKDRKQLIWSVVGMVEAFHVEDPGTDATKAGSNYLWAGGRLGLSFSDKPKALPNGYSIKAGADLFWDALSSKTVGFYDVSLSLFADPKQTTAVEVSYKKGTDRKNLKKVDVFGVNLTFKY